MARVPGFHLIDIPASLVASAALSLHRGARSHSSDWDDNDFAAGSPHEPSYIVSVARENRGSVAQCDRYHNGVNDIRRSGDTQQASCFVRLALAKRHDHAASQEAPELGLLRGPADLGDDRCGYQ